MSTTERKTNIPLLQSHCTCDTVCPKALFQFLGPDDTGKVAATTSEVQIPISDMSKPSENAAQQHSRKH